MPRSAQELPDAIQWHEGMLLAPQHFQQLALRGEELVSYHLSTAQPYHWGIRHLRTDRVLLVSGIYRILELEAVLPDGLIVSHVQGADDGPLELDLNAHAEALARGPLTLFLAVPVQRLGARQTAGELARYRSVEGAPVADDTTGEGSLRVPRLRPRLAILAGETLPDKYAGFPIARIVMEGESFAEARFVPAQLAITRTSAIGEACQDLAKRLLEKAVYLAERAGTPVGQSDQPMLFRTQMMINGLVAGLPSFEALLKTDRCHPFPLYLALTQIVGNMVVVGGAQVPPPLDAYDHDDPKRSFDAAIQFAIQMLDRVSESYTAIPFTDADNVFSLVLEESWYTDSLTVGVRARPEMTEQDVIAWIEGALIGTESTLPTMRETRVLGAARAQLDRDRTLDLVPTRGVVLFRIEVDSDFIKPGERLLVLSGDHGRRNAPREIVLYIRNAAAATA